jgi:hypothetical protein
MRLRQLSSILICKNFGITLLISGETIKRKEDSGMKAGDKFRLLIAACIAGLLSFSVFGANGMAQTKTVPVRRIGIEQKKQIQIKKLPDLLVAAIELDDDCHLIITIENAGASTIPDRQFKKCNVNVRHGISKEDFYLGILSKNGKPAIDTYGVLRKPGGKVTYNTKIKMEDTSRVEVHIDPRNLIAEADDDNNRRIATLKPNCPQVTPSFSKMATQASSPTIERLGKEVVKPLKSKSNTITRPKASEAAIMAMPRILRASDMERVNLIVLQGENLGSGQHGLQVRLVRTNTNGDPVMNFFLNVRSWNQSEIIAEMPDQLAHPSAPYERGASFTGTDTFRSGQFKVGLYRLSDSRWISNQMRVVTGAVNLDVDGDGHMRLDFGGDDCDDNDPDRFPRHPEIADFEGHDEDCEPTTIGTMDADGDGYTDDRVWNEPTQFVSMPPDFRGYRGNDCDDSRADVHPGQVEVCNKRDDNCDGAIDEGVMVTAYRDEDRDLYGDPSAPVQICYPELRSGLVTNSDDCDDSDPAINPREGNCP